MDVIKNMVSNVDDLYEAMGNVMYNNKNIDITISDIQNNRFGVNSTPVINLYKKNDILIKDENVFPCHKKKCCSTPDVTFAQLQTRSGDEPAVIYYVCNSCNRRWKE